MSYSNSDRWHAYSKSTERKFLQSEFLVCLTVFRHKIWSNGSAKAGQME